MYLKTVLSTVLLVFTQAGFSQNRTYLGVEFGPKFDIYQYADNGDALYTKPFLFSPIYGVTVGQEINRTFTLETGFFINDYGESYRIRGDIGWSSSSGIIAYQIPFRLKARLNLVNDRLNLISTLGYTFAINNDYGSEGYGSYATSGNIPGFNQRTETRDTSRYDFRRNYGMLETGLALEYQFKNSLSLYLAANYMMGFNRVIEMDVHYRIDNRPEQTGTVFSNGDYCSVFWGLRYPLSNIWKKNPDRER